ncbi:unnamed protein product [Owenia fusiformis]|uniref:Uncharacterized protein n=1 Tax=Owenia fusiformis TaxID=6347 RepID=A0A8J1TSX2_OWEFU|nr:unnamed protein product [Owenia fusiformis]
MESIYNLCEKPAPASEEKVKHTSKFRGTVTGEYKSNRNDYKTMGQAKVPTRRQDNFLKKHEKEPVLPDRTKFSYPDEERKRPNVPRKDDQPLMGLRTTKNFITNNAVENIMSVPKKAEKNYVDTKKGDKHPLETSGMEPHYLHKKDFGKTPAYLIKREEEIQRAQEEYDAYIAEHFRRGAMQQLSEEERRVILAGLKQNWEQLHHEYQGLSVVTDTAPKKNRKERMEAEMKQLERDIETVEKHKTIYIA